jgi:hypothetical protein
MTNVIPDRGYFTKTVSEAKHPTATSIRGGNMDFSLRSE